MKLGIIIERPNEFARRIRYFYTPFPMNSREENKLVCEVIDACAERLVRQYLRRQLKRDPDDTLLLQIGAQLWLEYQAMMEGWD
jgi:hypothetical protein